MGERNAPEAGRFRRKDRAGHGAALRGFADEQGTAVKGRRLPHQQQSQPQAEPAVFHRGGPAVPAEEILLNLLMEALTLVLDPEYSPLPVQSQGDLDGLSLGGEAQGIG